MRMNRKTRPICHGRMGKGNNRCSRVIGRVLAESLLGAVKSKANRDVTIRLDCHWHCCFYSFNAQNSGKTCLKSWKWQLEYGHSSTSQLRISILASTGSVQVTKNMRIVVVMLVFIVYCDVCDTTCCCVLLLCKSCTYVHCLCGFMCGTRGVWFEMSHVNPSDISVISVCLRSVHEHQLRHLRMG